MTHVKLGNTIIRMMTIVMVIVKRRVVKVVKRKKKKPCITCEQNEKDPLPS